MCILNISDLKRKHCINISWIVFCDRILTEKNLSKEQIFPHLWSWQQEKEAESHYVWKIWKLEVKKDTQIIKHEHSLQRENVIQF